MSGRKLHKNEVGRIEGLRSICARKRIEGISISLYELRNDRDVTLRIEGRADDGTTLDELRAELREDDPAIVLTVVDPEGKVTRRLIGEISSGFHRVVWDLRDPPSEPTSLEPPATDNPFADPPIGPMVLPGEYNISMASWVKLS